MVTDEEQILALGLEPFDEATGIGGGRFTGVGPVDGPADLPAGLTLPYGLIGFTIDGIAPGGTTDVSLVVMEGEPVGLDQSYWKYGPPTSDAAPTWYDFSFDEETGTGARFGEPVLGVGRPLVLRFTDGARGDTDGGANGSIRDPGGPATFTGDPTTVGPTPPVAPAPNPPVAPAPTPLGTPDPTLSPAPAPAASTLSGSATPADPGTVTAAAGPAASSGALPRTGGDPGDATSMAILLLLSGAVLLLIGRRSRRLPARAAPSSR
jgi:LPXTG-motif cell wall-anchored protein